MQSGNINNYKAATYNMRRAVKEAKRDNSKKVELQFQEGNRKIMWQILRIMTDYKSSPSSLSSADASIASEVNGHPSPFLSGGLSSM